MTKEYAKSPYTESLRSVQAGYWRCFPLSEISAMSRGWPPYRLSSGDLSGLNLGGNAESLRPMCMGEDSFFLCLLLREKAIRPLRGHITHQRCKKLPMGAINR